MRGHTRRSVHGMSLTSAPARSSRRPAPSTSAGTASRPTASSSTPYPRRVRALVGDARRARQRARPAPARVQPPAQALRAARRPRPGLLEPSDHTTHCPFKGDASYWSLRVGDRVRGRGVGLRGADRRGRVAQGASASLYRDKADAWFAEDERVFGHAARPVPPRRRGRGVAPRHRHRPRHGHRGARLAAKLLYETSVQPRVYVPGGDVVAGALVPSATRTSCPYKGEASYWTLQVDDTGSRTPHGASRRRSARRWRSRATSRSTRRTSRSRSPSRRTVQPRAAVATSRPASSARRRRRPSAAGRGRRRRPSRG